MRKLTCSSVGINYILLLRIHTRKGFGVKGHSSHAEGDLPKKRKKKKKHARGDLSKKKKKQKKDKEEKKSW